MVTPFTQVAASHTPATHNCSTTNGRTLDPVLRSRFRYRVLKRPWSASSAERDQ
jgi:hypothetical protein